MCVLCPETKTSKPAAAAIPPRPQALPVLPENIPPELKELRRWVLWRYTWKPKSAKWDKPPVQLSGKAARVNCPEDWNEFGPVAYIRFLKKYDGFGFVPTEADDLSFLDLDNVVNPDGTLRTWSPELRAKFAGDVPEPAELVALLGTYAELSPSGKGIRIVCRGTLPPGRRLIGGKGQQCPDGYESYNHHHYVTLTGWRLPQAPASIVDCTEKLAAVARAVFGEVKPEPAAAPRAPLPATWLDDLAVIEKARFAKNGAEFEKLWNGDGSGFQSRSEADWKLAGFLAFYCGPNPAQIERLMRQSGLVRDKWDRGQYLEKTITNCLKGRTEFYTGLGRSKVVAGSYYCDSPVLEESTVRENSHTTTLLRPCYDPEAVSLDKAEWKIPQRIYKKYDSCAWDCPKAFSKKADKDASPLLVCWTCRDRRNCEVCAKYWRLTTFNRFGFHLHNHDGQLYADTVPGWEWKATLESMRRKSKKLGVPLRFLSIRDDNDNLTVLASVPVADVARPVELAAALEILETAIDEAADGPRPCNACRAWGRLEKEEGIEYLPGYSSQAAFRATLLAWKASAVESSRSIGCDRPGLFLVDGKLDEQLRCDFWRECEVYGYAGAAAAAEIRLTLAAARERRQQGPMIDPANCFHDYQERPDPERPGWLKTSCPDCGKVLGSRPAGATM